MHFDVVIPTRGTIQNLLGIFESIDAQILFPAHIFVIVDRDFIDEDEWQEFILQATEKCSDDATAKVRFISNISDDFIPGLGTSYVRNYGIKLAKSSYVYLIDDDNILDPDFFEKSINEFESNSHHDTLLYSPTIGRRQTNRIQSVGIRKFHYGLARPQPIMGGWKTKLFGGLLNMFTKAPQDDNFYYPHMMGGNSLLGKTAHFKELLFDERMKFIFEDIDLTYRWYRQIGPIGVSKHNVIHHMERDKTKLEHSFIANEEGVYEKMKNRSIFVANNATFGQRTWYILLGIRINTLRFILFILLYGKEKGKLLKALSKGMNNGAKAFGKK